MKLVITGGTGFIGRPLCETLQQAGHELVVLTRTPRPGPNARIRFVVWKPGVRGPWQREFEGADGLINLAGESIAEGRWTLQRKHAIAESRVGTTKLLVETMGQARQKPRVLVNASAIGYYGPRGDEPVTEAESPGTGFLAETCRQWEQAAQAAESCGVRVVRLRIGIVLARDGGALAKMLPPFRWGLGGPLGSGRQWMSWIHRDDLAQLIRFALERPQTTGAFNATAPNPVTMREFARTLGRVLHRPAVAPVPGWVLRMALGEMAEMLLTGQRVLPDAARRLGFAFRYPKLAEALSACLQG